MSKATKRKWEKQKKVRLNEKGNRACDKDRNNSDQNIYSYMARMSGNNECTSRSFCDSSQLTNWILDVGAMCHMTGKVSNCISCSLEDTDKHIVIADGHQITAKQKRTSTNKNVRQ